MRFTRTKERLLGRHERWNVLLELLARDGQLEIDAAAGELNVSTATIRRDLNELADQQLLTRTRGGAVSHNVAYDLPLRYKATQRADEKQRIGKAAAGLVAAGSTIGLNGGTTTTEVARALARRGDLGAERNRHTPAITVVTNALNIAHELTVRPHIKIVVTGGVARPQSYELIGPLTGEVLAQIALDVAIIGVDGMDRDLGASAYHEGEAHTNNLLVRRAHSVVVVADSTKLGRRAFARICPVEAVDTLITDTAAPDGLVGQFTDIGIRVVQV